MILNVFESSSFGFHSDKFLEVFRKCAESFRKILETLWVRSSSFQGFQPTPELPLRGDQGRRLKGGHAAPRGAGQGLAAAAQRPRMRSRPAVKSAPAETPLLGAPPEQAFEWTTNGLVMMILMWYGRGGAEALALRHRRPARVGPEENAEERGEQTSLQCPTAIASDSPRRCSRCAESGQ